MAIRASKSGVKYKLLSSDKLIVKNNRENTVKPPDYNTTIDVSKENTNISVCYYYKDAEIVLTPTCFSMFF